MSIVITGATGQLRKLDVTPWPAAGLIATLHNTPFTAGSSSDNSITNPRRPAEYDSIEYGGLPVVWMTVIAL
jgi:hypothetical protein